MHVPFHWRPNSAEVPGHSRVSSSFAVYDEDDASAVLERILDADDDSQREPKLLRRQISRYRNSCSAMSNWDANSGRLQTLAELYADPNGFSFGEWHNARCSMSEQDDPEYLNHIYARHVRRLREENAMDLDDLLLNAWPTVTRSRRALEAVQERFCYIMVDEYQDTEW